MAAVAGARPASRRLSRYAARFSSSSGRPASQASSRPLTGFCQDIITWFIWFVSFGGSRELFRASCSRRCWPGCSSAPSGRSTSASAGRGRSATGGAVIGESKPVIGEAVALLLRCSGEWRDYMVTGVVDGRAGSWQVRTRPLGKRDEVRPMCITGVCSAR